MVYVLIFAAGTAFGLFISDWVDGLYDNAEEGGEG